MSATSPVGREVGGRMPVRWALGELAGPNLLVPLLAVAATVALVFEPMAAVALVLAVFAAIALPRLQPEHVLVALLLYMPFENQALTYAPGGWTPFVRYAPEALIDLAVILVVFGNLERVWTGLGRLRWPLVLLLSSWLASAIWSGIEATTAFVGFRSELRFLPLLLVAVLARDPARDARLYGRAIVIVGTVEAAIIAAQALAGAPARDAFAPDWTIEINGVAFADAGFNKPETNFGTFSNYNAAGTFLVFAWIIMAAAGSRRLGLPARLGFFMGCAMALAVGLSGSRESGLALAVAALIIAHVRFRRWVAPAVVFATVAALLVGPWVMAARNGVPEGEVNGKSFSERWAYVMSPDAWSTDQRNNFRLFLLRENASLVTDNSPALRLRDRQRLGQTHDSRRLEPALPDLGRPQGAHLRLYLRRQLGPAAHGGRHRRAPGARPTALGGAPYRVRTPASTLAWPRAHRASRGRRRPRVLRPGNAAEAADGDALADHRPRAGDGQERSGGQAEPGRSGACS